MSLTILALLLFSAESDEQLTPISKSTGKQLTHTIVFVFLLDSSDAVVQMLN